MKLFLSSSFQQQIQNISVVMSHVSCRKFVLRLLLFTKQFFSCFMPFCVITNWEKCFKCCFFCFVVPDKNFTRAFSMRNIDKFKCILEKHLEEKYRDDKVLIDSATYSNELIWLACGWGWKMIPGVTSNILATLNVPIIEGNFFINLLSDLRKKSNKIH